MTHGSKNAMRAQGVKKRAPYMGSVKKNASSVNSALQRENLLFECALTHRFSQDTIKMFFSQIRGHLGWNKNQNTLQRKYALRVSALEKQC